MKLNVRNVKEVMIQNGWNQGDLADECKIGKATISRALNGKEVYPKTINKLYRTLGISLEELVDWGDNDGY